MRMMKRQLAALLLTAPLAAVAAPKSKGQVDVYYDDADLELDTPVIAGEDSGSGFGIRGSFKFAPKGFVHGEYETRGYDALDDLTTTRFGIGLQAFEDALSIITLKLEYADFDFEDGFGLHAGMTFWPVPEVSLFGEVGWVKLDELEGLEYSFGGAYDISKGVALLAQYRATQLENGPASLDLNDVQLGLRFTF